MKVIGKIFAVLYCIVYFFILTAFMVVSFSLSFVSANYYTDVVKSIDLKTLKASDFEELLGEDLGLEEGATLEDVVVLFFAEGGIDKELAIALANNEKIREVMGKFIGDYINYNVGGPKPIIEKEDIKEVLEQKEVKNILDQSSEDFNISVDEVYDSINGFVETIIEGGNDGNNTERNYYN